MNYIEYRIETPDSESADILVAELAELGFDSFSDFQSEGFIECYIPSDAEKQSREQTEAYLKHAGVTWQRTEIEQQNWNAEWESNFDPIAVGEGDCLIRAPFHDPAPAGTRHEIVIMPKMSFGTGHHATTSLMVERMLSLDFEGTTVLDMGSGTGILAILAAQRGAVITDAVDIDEWAYENCLENIRMNDVAGAICPILGDAAAIGDKIYDVILANINRNILLADMERYVSVLRPGGLLLVSGILEMDIQAITVHARKLDLTPTDSRLKSGWAQITFQK